jgi:SAM-dependent methyltransferase
MMRAPASLDLCCRSCGRAGLAPVLSLGELPLANRLLRADQLAGAEPRYPLDLAFCTGCALVQITATIPPEVLFRDYVYFSSFAETMLRSAEAIARRLIRERHLDGASLVVELASNDGYLLQFYRRAGVQVLGIEPARNVARVAQENGIPTIAEFFGDDLAAALAAEGTRADVVHANNVLAHVPDQNGFVRGIGTVLKDAGVAVIEVPYVRDLVERSELDTIYHEHLCYYSLTALGALFGRQGLTIRDVERLPIHGGSLRLFVGKRQAQSDAVRALSAEERALGMDRLEYYRRLADRVESVRRGLRDLLAELKRRGQRIAAYGAAAKGATLLNCCGLGTETLEYVVDRSRYKQGQYMPGVRLPIHPPERLLASRPDYLLVLAWNIADEIMAQQAEYRAGGGRFIIPIPEPRIVDGPEARAGGPR